MAIRRKRRLWVAGLIERSDNQMLIELAAPTDEPRLWRFPRTPAQEDEVPEAAMRRLGQSLIGVTPEIVVGQPPIVARIDEEEVELRYFFCGAATSEINVTDEEKLRWIPKTHLREYDFDEPSRPVVEWLLEND